MHHRYDFNFSILEALRVIEKMSFRKAIGCSISPTNSFRLGARMIDERLHAQHARKQEHARSRGRASDDGHVG